MNRLLAGLMSLSCVAVAADPDVVTAAQMASALQRDGKVALRGSLFAPGQDTFKPESDAQLAQIVALLERDPDLELSIDVHTDNRGNAKFNLVLSTKRAERLKTFLLGKGVDDARLQSRGLGETTPVAPNTTEEGRAFNSRVELVKR